jgi:hypothetical protein
MGRRYETDAVRNQEPGCALQTRLAGAAHKGMHSSRPAREAAWEGKTPGALRVPEDTAAHLGNNRAVTMNTRAADNTPDHLAALSA